MPKGSVLGGCGHYAISHSYKLEVILEFSP